MYVVFVKFKKKQNSHPPLSALHGEGPVVRSAPAMLPLSVGEKVIAIRTICGIHENAEVILQQALSLRFRTLADIRTIEETLACLLCVLRVGVPEHDGAKTEIIEHGNVEGARGKRRGHEAGVAPEIGTGWRWRIMRSSG